MRIAIVGEYNPTFPPHTATDAAIAHAASHLQLDVDTYWLTTTDIGEPAVHGYDAFWIAPGSPYKDMAKTIWLIQQARERGTPCLGTCGGFQHMVIEFARNVLGVHDAQHAEYDPYASRLIISRLACSLVGKEMTISFTAGSCVAEHYGTTTALEKYYCNFGVHPEFTSVLADSEFRIVGFDAEGEARVMEISSHPFFVGTLFVPQARSTPRSPHPLVLAFLKAAYQSAMTKQGSR